MNTLIKFKLFKIRCYKNKQKKQQIILYENI